MIHACVHGKFQSALILIENGAELDLKDDEGCTALHHAARQFDYYSVSEIQYSELSLDWKNVQMITSPFKYSLEYFKIPACILGIKDIKLRECHSLFLTTYFLNLASRPISFLTKDIRFN